MPKEIGCSARDCAAGGAVGCAYVDRRLRRCGTAWCTQHRHCVGGRDYCRRHAGVVRALGEQPAAGLPEVDNRAASLAAHLGDELDGRVTTLLGRVVARSADASLINHPVRLVKAPGGRERRWQRTWNVVDSTGIVSRVTIEVDESDDRVVTTSVGSSRIGRGTPPWIGGRDGDGDSDAERHTAYVDAIGRSIEMILTRPEMAPSRL
jgi:hypothetical protein